MLRRLKRLTSHAGQARFLAACDDTPYEIARRRDIPSPYASAPTHLVYRHEGRYVILVETAHRRYDVFLVPARLLEEASARQSITTALRVLNDVMDEDGMACWVDSALLEETNPFSHQSGPNGCQGTCPACAWETLTGKIEEDDDGTANR